jgi:catechol 2,3-dioxygenase-like lactoylglutathione lyase family enzyme
MRITGIDHVVLNVSDAERSVAWFRDVLGLEPERLDEWRAGTVPFVSVRINPTTILDLLETERSGENMNHLALVVEGAELQQLLDDGRITADGPHQLFGAQGTGLGVYLCDPDGNGIELRTYGK